MNKIERCAIYIRVSTTEQAMHGKSLEAQTEYLTQYAKNHDMHIVGVYADEGKTARKNFKNRKAIKELLEHVKNDEIDVIIFWRMDRWFRNVSDFYKVQDILDAHGTRWVSTSEPNISTETREGRLNLNLVLTIGQNETDTTSERIRFVNEASVNSGKVIFGSKAMPLGFTTGIVDGVKRMIKDPETEECTNAVFKYLLTHQGKRATVSYIRSNYMESFTMTMLNTMIKSTLYKGCYRNNTNYCPRYISDTEYDRLQDIRKRNVKSTPSGNVYLFTGMIRCPQCGKMLHGYYSKRSRVYIYYRCTYGAKNSLHPIRPLNEETIEKYLIEDILNVIDRHRTQSSSFQEKKLKSKESEQDLRKEMERLNYMFQKSRVSIEKYEKDYSTLELRLSEAQKAVTPIMTDYARLEKTFNSSWSRLYGELTRDNKRAFWRDNIKQIIINKDNELEDIIFF